MTPLRRIAAFSAPVVLALSLTACGGGDSGGSGSDGGGGGGSDTPATAADAPTDATEDDFCGVLDDFEGEAEDIGDDDTEAQADFLGEVADKFKEVGTPEAMPEDARAGFEVVIDTWADLDASDLEGDAGDQLGLTPADQEQATTFLTYATDTCGLDEE